MVYVFVDGRVLCEPKKPSESDVGNYIELESYPTPPEVVGKVGYISGCDLVSKEVIFSYADIQTPVPEVEEPHFTKEELFMQAMTDSELRDIEAQEERKMLAQQMTDIELAVLGGGTTV